MFIAATGIDRSRVEDMENRLRADVLREVTIQWLCLFALLFVKIHLQMLHATQCWSQL